LEAGEMTPLPVQRPAAPLLVAGLTNRRRPPDEFFDVIADCEDLACRHDFAMTIEVSFQRHWESLIARDPKIRQYEKSFKA
jgi:hypothetical protein